MEGEILDEMVENLSLQAQTDELNKLVHELSANFKI